MQTHDKEAQVIPLCYWRSLRSTNTKIQKCKNTNYKNLYEKRSTSDPCVLSAPVGVQEVQIQKYKNAKKNTKYEKIKLWVSKIYDPHVPLSVFGEVVKQKLVAEKYTKLVKQKDHSLFIDI